MLNKIKYSIYRFMYGRNGYDDLGRAMLSFAMILCVISFFFRNAIFNFLLWVLLLYILFRAFSKNIAARRRENEKFIYLVKPAAMQWQVRKTHVVFRCKDCGQIIRVPKGKGLIEITCPKCRIKITKRT
ncbi:MAG: hypothetical protein Q4C49_07305 [Bacillota bacterium]|nr:hypothetical protein [Bacillota bacterium]